jgi:hypothetical protein
MVRCKETEHHSINIHEHHSINISVQVVWTLWNCEAVHSEMYVVRSVEQRFGMAHLQFTFIILWNVEW